MTLIQNSTTASAADLLPDGALMAASGDWDGAAEVFRATCTVEPDSWFARRQLGRCLMHLGRFRESAEAFASAVALKPGSADLHLRRAKALRAAGDWDQAEASLLAAVEIDENDVALLVEFASLYMERGLDRFALPCIERAHAVAPGDHEVSVLYAFVCASIGNVASSLDGLRPLVEQGQLSSREHSRYFTTVLHAPAVTGLEIRAEHEKWARLHAPNRATPAIWTRPNAARRIRVGYHSGEFSSSPAFYFIGPLFRECDRNRFELFTYSLSRTEDAKTKFFRENCDHWRESLDPSSLARDARADCLDLFVDISGHWTSNCFSHFADRIAPLQVTYPNYPCTTGVPAVDYIFTDRWVCPEGSESQYTETPYFLDRGYLPYQAPEGSPTVSVLPAIGAGTVTFGLFQRPLKMNTGAWDAVAQVLRSLPSSSLLVHYALPNYEVYAAMEEVLLKEELAARGVDPARARFVAGTAHPEHLSLLSSVDIALDTFPYNGQTTTCECIWMGVPVVTLRGSYHLSRVGHQLLDRLGLAGHVATDPSEYVRLACDLARDLDRLVVLRHTLRDRLLASPLCDGSVQKSIEQAYVDLLERHSN